MQGSVSFPAALGSNLWIANFLDKYRDDEGVHVSSSESQPSKNEAKFQKLYRKATAELRSVFNDDKSSGNSDLNGEHSTLAPLLPYPLVRTSDLGPLTVEQPTTTHNAEHTKKSSWYAIFDTKSGNKLHKRTRSAPTSHYVPHVLETIGEEPDYHETAAFQSFLMAAQDSESGPEATATVPDNTGGHVSPDGDDVSINTTCTVIIRRAAFNDSTVENRTDSDQELKPISQKTERRKTVSFDIEPSSELPQSQIECSGALLTPSIVEGIGNDSPDPKQKKRKRSKSINSILSVIGKVRKLAKKKLAIEQPIEQATESRRPILRHKGAKLNNWKNDDAKMNENTGDNHPTLQWDPPEQDNAMDDLLRNFSGALNFPDNNETGAPYFVSYGKELTNLPDFDKSVEDLAPRPAMQLNFGRSLSHCSHDSICNPKRRSNGNHGPKEAIKENSSLMSDEEAHDIPTIETELQAFARHRQCIERIKGIYDRQGIGRTGKFPESKPSLYKADEQRQLREMTEDLKRPPKELQPEENKPQCHDEGLSKSADGSSNKAQGQLTVNTSPNQEASDDQVLTPEDIAIPSIEVPHDEQRVKQDNEIAPKTDDLSVAKLETDTDTETNTDTSADTGNVLPNEPLTVAALKDLENEQYSAFFKSLQQVREKSPDRFCSRQGAVGIRAWIAQIREHDDMERDEAAERFFEYTPSSEVNDDTLSELDHFPSMVETMFALQHPDCPPIRGTDAEQAKVDWNDYVMVMDFANTAKETLHSQVLSSLTRNELIEDECDRAERVTYLHRQKKALETEEAQAAKRRYVRKVCRQFEKALDEVQRRSEMVKKEADDAQRCVKYLQRSYDEMEESIHRNTEALGYQRADNIVDAMELIKKTEREENIDIRQIERRDLAEPESPDSYGASEYYGPKAKTNEDLEPENPSDLFF
ncbi:uncharacterized protein B0J16DRAFT_390953 [Fusarium flagelliforme]|uniref:uncharacterized protein n=1 Tax=Fusarium flagelliforme TaxID=2675880 RepID=UPI001E8D9BA1|nr:uncharacterized protein B0J16DRAFT_390953 [Fusarium flagelliforme]KAH7197111.1 hypothetical protein B0J16DRAFT_390953 [Fusarium flagelliforme]